MLDQNTDRMWYVIGAVLIGAAIILGMNTMMPSAFASVTDSFQTLTQEVNVSMSGDIFNKHRMVNLGISGYNPRNLNSNFSAGLTGSGTTKGFYWSVSEGESFTITRSDIRHEPHSRFAIGYSAEEPVAGTNLFNIDSTTQNDLSFTTTVPEGANYAFLYLYNHRTPTEYYENLPEIEIIQNVE